MNLERAIEIAVQAHKGQIDKGGSAYVLHPIRVMMACSNEISKIVGILHDVVEDSDWTFAMLEKEGFSANMLAALDSVTERNGESYDDFVARAAANPISKEVKIADIKDNMDLTRISSPTQKDYDRIAKYKKSLAFLEGN